MHKWAIPLLVGTLLALGCGKTDAPQTQTKPQPERQVSDPAAFVTESFLAEQQSKRVELRRKLDSLHALPMVERKEITSLINRRKGELMSLKKNLRNSTVLSQAQRDSLISPLEEESIELAGDLIAAAK